MLVSSTSASTRYARFMLNGWCISWTRSLYRAAQQRIRTLIWNFYADLECGVERRAERGRDVTMRQATGDGTAGRGIIITIK